MTDVMCSKRKRSAQMIGDGIDVVEVQAAAYFGDNPSGAGSNCLLIKDIDRPTLATELISRSVLPARGNHECSYQNRYLGNIMARSEG